MLPRTHSPSTHGNTIQPPTIAAFGSHAIYIVINR